MEPLKVVIYTETSESPEQAPRDLLTPDSALGAALGLQELRDPALRTGRASFDNVIFEASVESKNSVPSSSTRPLRIIELNEITAIFEYPKHLLEARDRLRLRFEFRSGELSRFFEVEWIVSDVVPVEGPTALIYGSFGKKGQEDLRQMLRLFDRREDECRGFFSAARGY